MNLSGQLGTGLGEASIPKLVDGISLASIAAGQYHTCGVSADGDVYCWGNNDYGQVGDGTQNTRREPAPVTDGAGFLHVTVGGIYTCGLRQTGEVWFWGYNESGQLGAAVPQLCSVSDELGNVQDFPCTLVPIRGAPNLLFSQISIST